MNTPDLIAEIDTEIARLQEVRALLAGSGIAGASKSRALRAGRSAKVVKRKLSPEARERIRQAQVKRWAKAKKAAAK